MAGRQTIVIRWTRRSAHLKSAFPLTTPEWSAWSATMRSPRIEGTWALGGDEPGEGPLIGRVTITAGASPDEFTTDVTYTYSRSGRTVTRTGRALIYTGYQWRGRTTVGGDDATSLREVMFVERDWQTITGRWFAGGYDELGLDVTLTRIGREAGGHRPRPPPSVRGSSAGQQVQVYGENLPSTLAPADVDFGQGVTVTRVVSSSPTSATLEVDVAGRRANRRARRLRRGSLPPGRRSPCTTRSTTSRCRRAGTWRASAASCFRRCSRGSRRLAGATARTASRTRRTTSTSARSRRRGRVEEYTATFDDDDMKFVGEIDGARGLFTPAVDGPNPKRSGNRNNVGDVWVVATHTPAPGAAPMRARAHLVVTVPLYMRWDFSTVNQR